MNFRSLRSPLLPGLVLLCLCLGGCQPPDPPKTLTEPSPAGEEEGRLTLNNATLEQADSAGQPLWKLAVEKALYSKDQKIAQLQKVKGNIYQDGKIVLQVSADRGEVRKGGEEMYLKDNIVAIDPRNQTVIRSQEVEWRPKEGRLIVRKDLQGSNAKLDATALEGHYNTKEQRLDLIGNVVATAKQSQVQLKTDSLIWEVGKEKLIGEQPMKFDRYKDKTKVVIDRVTAGKGQVDLKTHLATLENNLQYYSLEPAVTINGESGTWNYQDRIIKSEKPVQLLQRQDNVLITGNRATVNLTDNTTYLENGAKGINQKTGAKLYSEKLLWKMRDKIVEAEGNVIYEQLQPKFNLTGDKAVGTLNDDNVVVTSQSSDRVVTEIFPQKQ
ncbi:MAG: Lipopolysaccharide export system protein LptC [Chroococcopsis gigantea SAG 12.99]|jgi:LPS export ABC transporter protein LptC|nr:LPS export ABC transporter periplasmic protein LptC [Chlorogloea purpurea SAG 13.99]MDV2999051.1 Lipopolysaccharide export system protein LptC [Chroococcopsis gigantea SAG 12.99]